MIDAATRSVSRDETKDVDINSDDPLFELSRIMGFADEESQSDSSQIDPQIDLEDALLAELSVENYAEAPEESVEPYVEAPEHIAPTVSSLEDELAAMLGGNVSVGTEVPEYAAQVSEELAPLVEEPVSHEFEQAAPEASLDDMDTEASFADMDEELEAIQLQEAIQPATLDDRSYEEPAPLSEPAAESFEQSISVEETAVSEPVAAFDDNALENEFATFFNEDLAETNTDIAPEYASMPEETMIVDEPPLSLSAAVDESISQFDSNIEDNFSQHYEEPVAQADTAGAPVLDTTDMSAFNDGGPVAIDVPQLPDVDSEFSSSFEDDLDIDFDEASLEVDDSWPATTAAVAATSAVAGVSALSRRAGETAMANDDESFDETRFEAELARDIEFVSHDTSNLGNASPDAYDDGFEGAAAGPRYDEPKTVKRGLVVAAVLGCVAIVGAIGIFALSGGGTNSADGPVLVKASSDPVKVAPENPGGKEVPNQDRAVFSESRGVPSQEELVSTSEEPVDIAAVPENALPSSLNGEDLQKGEDRLEPSAQTSASNEAAPFVVAPRKVRTLVVRADGTLVEREVVPTPAPIASQTPATEVASADQAQLGGVPVGEAVNGEDSAVADEPAATPERLTPSEPAAAPALPTRTVQTKTISPSNIAERPKDQPVNIVNPEPTQVAAAPAAPTAATEAAPTPYSVQMASLPTEADAQQSARTLSSKFGNVLGGRDLVIRKAVIEGKGTYYRVRVGANDRAEANGLCERIKSAGGSCFVTR
ncbi:SPOR domain-containing protein [Ahrensia kielensis]|uniref:SPOR domain-containing protein n=1 Tax=Ahrensia kielensis TaxID=76980 RepID=A0ABU9T5K0_9HYPH